MTDRSTVLAGIYTLETSIGHGETGEVVQARRNDNGQLVTIKLISENLAVDPVFRAALRPFAATLRTLHHPHIAIVLEVSTQQNACYLVMERQPDRTVADLLHEGTIAAMAIPERVEIAYQVALALQEAHTHGLIHGSVTPDDMFISTDQGLDVHLTDFGVAWLAIHSEAMTPLWSESLIYAMPPERCQGIDLDERGDIYALGAVLYELLVGQPPFEAKTLDAAVFRHVYTEPTFPRDLSVEISHELEAIVLRCLAKQPADRYTTAAELAAALEPFLPPPPSQPEPPAIEPTVALPIELPNEHVTPATPDIAVEAELPAEQPATDEALGSVEEPQPPAEAAPTELETNNAPTERQVRRAPAAPRVPLELLGRIIGGYVLESYLGVSETGDVYQARHTEQSEPVALKLIHDALAYDQFFDEQFAALRPILLALQHPNVVHALDAGSDDEHGFLVVEWLPDGTLRNLFRRRADGQSLPLRLGVELIRQAASGLEFLHAQGLFHGALKPNNLLLARRASGSGPEYTVKIADAGLAWLALHSEAMADEIWADTLIYAMPPERCQGLELDGRGDIYALGVILYELATGSPPFEAKTLDAAVFRHVYTQPTAPRTLDPQIPATLEAIVLRCLAKRPSDRYATAGELALALQQLLDGDALIPPPAEVVPPPSFNGAVVPLNGPYSARVSALDPYGRALAARDLTGEGLTVGRAPNNDIVLPSEQIAPQHLQIDWDGASVLATNVSSNGDITLGESKLPPKQAAPWAWDAPLRVGPFWMRVEPVLLDEAAKTNAAAPAVVNAFDEPVAPEQTPEATPAPTEVLSDRIGIVLETDTLQITPGRPTTFRLTLANFGHLVDHLTVTVEQVSGAWLAGTPPVVQLNPGAQALVTLNVLVAQVPENEAGDYAVLIRARSRENPQESNTAGANWTVLPFTGSSFDTRPRRLKRRLKGRYDLTLRNLGNAPARFALTAADEEEALSYQFRDDVLTLLPGATARTQLIARPQQLRWYGQGRTHRFTVVAHPGEGQGDLQSAGLQLEQQALIPRWSLVILTILLAVLAVWMWLQARPVVERLAADPQSPIINEPFRVVWDVRNARLVEVQINATPHPITDGSSQLVFRGISAPTTIQLIARNWMFGQAAQSLNIIPLQPTSIPTPTPLPTLEPTIPPPPTLEPTIPPPPTAIPPTATATIVPTPTSQTLCVEGGTTDIVGYGPPNTGFLVYFAKRVVAGGLTAANGFFSVRLGPINEQPGRYQVEVRDRTTNALLRGVTCIVP